MLKIYTSNSLHELAEAISGDFICSPLPPQEPDTIIVQSESLAFWLRLRLAEKLGCAAGLQMLFPGTLCQKLTARPDSPAPSQDYLNWQIFDLLGNNDFTSRFPPLQRYLQDNDPVKRLQFSLRLGSLFNNYLIYRNPLLLDWESGKAAESETGQWQSEIWRALSDAPRAGDFSTLLEKMNQDILPSRLSAFAPSTLPPLFLEFLRKAADYIPVNIYAVSPTPHFWSDILSQREILRRQEEYQALDSTPASRFLASLGRQGREFFFHLGEMDNSGQAREELDYPEPSAHSLLGALQQRIYSLGMDEPTYTPRPDDDSLIINNCHSPLREVEILHQWVLEILATEPQTQPSDILVLVSRLEDYTPWIKAVFGSCEILQHSFRISDNNPTAQEEFEQSILALLALPSSRFEASRILELLDNEPIRAASRLSQEEIRELVEAVVELNIRWGVNSAQQKSSGGISPCGINSWQTGIDRLLMGFASGEVDQPLNGILPYCSELSRETVARFCIWLDKLSYFCQTASKPCPLSNWQKILNTLCTQMLGGKYAEDIAEDDPAQQLLGEFPENDTPISHQTIRYFLEQKFSHGGGASFLGGGINFCSLKPLRSVPFPVIAVLGLGYEQFPRRERREQYNLMQASRIIGDPSSRDDDRQLFLETLLSAQERLVLSYSGQSQKDQSISPPSVCISEMLDFIDEEFGNGVASSLTTQHPLQPFSGKYYDSQNRRLFSYTPELQLEQSSVQSAKEMSLPNGSETTEDAQNAQTETIQLEELIRFFRNPSRYYSQQVLGLRVPYEEACASDVEAMGEDRQELRTVQNELLRRATESPTQLSLRLNQLGVLPDVTAGELLLQMQLKRLAPLRELARELPEPRHLFVRVRLSKTLILEGTVENLYPDGRILLLADKANYNDEIGFWLNHLLLSCADTAIPQTSFLHTPEKTYQLVTAENAAQHLRGICSMMRRGLSAPLLFFPKSSRAFSEQEYKLSQPSSRSRTSAIDKALQVWNGGQFSFAEKDNDYFKLCFRNAEPLQSEQFATNANTFWSGYFSHLEENA